MLFHWVKCLQVCCSVVSGCLWPQGLQQARLPSPSPTPRACPNPCPSPSSHLILCHPLLLLPSVFPRIKVFSNESVLCIRCQSIGPWASASVLPMNIQDWFPLQFGFLVAQRLKRLPLMRETWVWSLGQEDPLEKDMATHSSILAWRILWTEEPGGLQSTGSLSRTWLSDLTFNFSTFLYNWMVWSSCSLGTHKSLLQHHSSKASVLWHSALFMVQLSHPYMTTGKTIALTRRTFVGKVMSLLFNMLSRLVTAFYISIF